MLLQLFNFSTENRNLFSLKFVILKDFLHGFIKNLVFVSLLLHITFKCFIIWSSFSMKLILNHFSFFNQYIHHDINFFPYLISFFFKKLKIIISENKGVLNINKIKMGDMYILTSRDLIYWLTDIETSSIRYPAIIWEPLVPARPPEPIPMPTLSAFV